MGLQGSLSVHRIHVCCIWGVCTYGCADCCNVPGGSVVVVVVVDMANSAGSAPRGCPLSILLQNAKLLKIDGRVGTLTTPLTYYCDERYRGHLSMDKEHEIREVLNKRRVGFRTATFKGTGAREWDKVRAA